MVPDNLSIPGYTIYREGESRSAAAQIPRRTPHPLGMMTFFQDGD
jgi:hypothetical protein